MKKHYPVQSILFFLGEGCIIFLTINIIYLAFVNWSILPEDIWLNVVRSVIVTGVFQLSLYFFDLYHPNLVASQSEIFSRMIQAFGFGCIILAGFYYFIPSLIISTSIFWTFYAVVCLILFGWRTLYSFILKKRLFASPIIILGTGKISAKIVDLLATKRDSDFRIAAFVGQGTPQLNPDNVPVIQNSDSLLSITRKYKSNIIVVAIDDRRHNMPIQDLMDCKFHGVSIKDGISFFESISGRISVENVNPTWFIFAEGFQMRQITFLIKRFLDIIISTIGLLITSPISMLTAICIKLESPGSVLYSQERIGERGSTFFIYKFRSMCQDSEKNGAVWARENDSRVTKIGKFIRKSRIDEIPQMWNVLKGDMSFVGPRPERPIFVDELVKKIPYYSLRHAIKPGLTGLAQIRYQYGASEEDALRKLEYDIYYMKNLSILFDLFIIFVTIKIVLFQKGAR
jgi:sugar transferase (PEP-CTERM system associated)